MKKYKAFISYSHKDKKFAKWLHIALETYKIPKELRKKYKNLPQKLYPIFRDKEELSTSSNLSKNIIEALMNSEYLIVICSIDSAKSYWVNQEIIDFKNIHGENNVLAIILNGEPNAKDSDNLDDNMECFPKAIKYSVHKGKLTNERVEPLAGDVRDGKEFVKLKIIAGILKLNFDELNRREEKRKKKKRLTWSIFAITLIVIMSGLALFGFSQMRIAQIAQKEAEHQLIVATKRTQTLAILTQMTIKSLMLTDKKILSDYLNKVLDSGHRDIFIEMLKPLILETDSMDKEEKQYWYDILPSMNNKQVYKLVNILMTEKYKMHKLISGGKGLEILKKGLKDIRKKSKYKCFKEKEPYYCLKTIYLELKYPYIKDNKSSLEEYFKFYYKLHNKKPTAFYFYVYSLYLKKQGKIKESFKNIQRALLLKPNDIDIIKDIIPYYKKNNLSKAIKLQQKIVSIRKKDLIKSKNKTEKIRAISTFIYSIDDLIILQYSKDPKSILNNTYPKYKKDLNLLEKNIPDFSIYEFLHIYAYIAFAYADIKKYHNSIEILKKLLYIYNNKNKKALVKKSWISKQYLNLSWYQLLNKDYNDAIQSSKEGLKIDVNRYLSLEVNLAHAYLLSNKYKLAKIIYIKNKNKKFKNGKLWQEVIRKDFADLKKLGIYNKNFHKIEELLFNK